MQDLAGTFRRARAYPDLIRFLVGRAFYAEDKLDGIRAQVPIRRLGRADEVARVVHFLCDDNTSYVTGQVWAVNGGMDM